MTIMWLILAGGIVEIDWEFVANLPPEWVLTGAISIGAGKHVNRKSVAGPLKEARGHAARYTRSSTPFTGSALARSFTAWCRRR